MFKINKDITMKLIFIISLFALASAFFIEYVLGHQPCNLCILERIPYLLAIIIVLLNYKFSQLEKNFILVITLIFLRFKTIANPSTLLTLTKHENS